MTKPHPVKVRLFSNKLSALLVCPELSPKVNPRPF